jgi:hypothetical protein
VLPPKLKELSISVHVLDSLSTSKGTMDATLGTSLHKLQLELGRAPSGYLKARRLIEAFPNLQQLQVKVSREIDLNVIHFLLQDLKDILDVRIFEHFEESV